MTTDPNVARPQTQTRTSPPAAPPTVAPPIVPSSAAPYGIAPMAADVAVAPRRTRRRRIVDAAVVTSALATLPIAAAWSRTGPDEDTRKTLVEAVSELDAAADETAFRASTAALHSTAARQGVAPAGPRTPVGPPEVSPAAMTPDGHPTASPGAAVAPAPPELATTEEDAPATLAAATEAADATEATAIARVVGIELLAPADTVLVGFHEAASPGTLEMEALAPLSVALNGARTEVAPDASADQVAPVMELPTRDRGQGPASAVDIAVPAWRDITAPVSGKVTAVDPYTLYGEFPDNRVEIEPEGQPGVRVVMIHIGEIEVRPGDEVVAGETLIARTAKQFPFPSQIDRFSEHASGEARPHVHIEVIRAG